MLVYLNPQNQGTRFIRNTIALASVGQERLFIYDLMGWDLGVEPRLVAQCSGGHNTRI